MDPQPLPQTLLQPTAQAPDLQALAKIPAARRKLAHERLSCFFTFYFTEYITHQAAPFHGEMLQHLEDDRISPLVITAFRGSAKSSLATLAYPLWAIMGKPGVKYILIASQTQEQARQHLRNIRDQLEQNELLRQDLGPFREEEDEWRNTTIVLSNYGARITAISVSQNVRGLRHGPHRPQLLICDDIEDEDSVKAREGRDHTWAWLTGNAIPASDFHKRRVVIVGTPLHDDSVLMRFRKAMNNGGNGKCLWYPLYDADKKPLWPAMFPDEASIEKLQKEAENEITFQREYLLTIVSPEDQVIKPEWIQRYDYKDLPCNPSPEKVFSSVDPAISEEDGSCYTAIVSGFLLGTREKPVLYILDDIFNKRVDVNVMLDELRDRSVRLGNGMKTKIIIETQGFQLSIEQLLTKDRYPVKGVRVGMDKRTRLSLTAAYIKDGSVLFPKGSGINLLIEQMTGFGTERYNDLADAFSMLVLHLLHTGKRTSLGMATYDPVTQKMIKQNLEEIQQDTAIGKSNVKEYLKFRQAYADEHEYMPLLV